MQTLPRIVLLAAVGVNCLVVGQNSARQKIHHRRFGVLPDANLHLPPYQIFSEDDAGFESDEIMPETFDAREKWPECPSIGEIYNQENCGSCWAVAAATTMTDRICIHSKGDLKFQVSVENLLACCSDCGPGCQGGSPATAWYFWAKKGLVSGGGYDSHQGCQPYTIDYSWPEDKIRPECYPTCADRNYTICYNQEKTFGLEPYHVKPTVEAIQREIMTNGPVQASFTVYDDFMAYKPGGVYGEDKAGHSVRLLGWGVERKMPYWLAANSWGVDHFGEDGFFKILRGEDYCGIESSVVAGLPNVYLPPFLS